MWVCLHVQSCPTLFDSHGLPGSSVLRILQARVCTVFSKFSEDNIRFLEMSDLKKRFPSPFRCSKDEGTVFQDGNS